MRRFEKRSGLNVVNLGFFGWAPTQYPEVLRRHAPALKPRLVLWMFFINDLVDNVRINKWRRSGQRWPWSTLQ